MKKIISIILVLTTLALVLCACQKQENKNEDTSYKDSGKAQIVKISLPFSSGDSLNPFFATGNENLALAYVYARPLFTVKSDYKSEPVIAESISINGKSADVRLNPVIFSDGTAVSAADIVYSFELAKKSPAFSQRLRNIEKAEISAAGVLFTLKSADKLVSNVLTFPVVKSGTAQSEKDIPTGSGVFMFEGKTKMVVNPYCQTITAINTIELCDIKTPELAVNALEIGNINYLFEDFSEGVYRGIVSQSKNVTMNNFVYLGINCKNDVLSSAALRTAMYYAINKENASQTPYQGYCVAAATPFNPDFYELSKLDLPKTEGDKAKARAIIEKLGYKPISSENSSKAASRELEFTLIVNKNNPFRVAAANKIAQELDECGFKIEVARLDSESYKERIEEGKYQLCLGEVKLPENMDLYAFGSGFYKEALPEEGMHFFKDYSAYKAGKKDMNTLVDSFLDDVPFIPICYRMGVAAYTKTYSPDFTYAPFDIYGNLENWETVK